jgi:hypothetical protein
MMMCAVVVVCAVEAHNVVRRFSCPYNRGSRHVSMNIGHEYSQVGQHTSDALHTSL